MYVDPRRTSSDELVEHKQFLERLATRLTRDPELAGDLVQDTWLAALRHPPQREGSVRGWLATVMRNVHINRLRSETRAQQRQRQLRALPEECSSDEAAEVLELQARITSALATLEPAQHEVLVLRYLDGLPPRAIAQRLGLPVETVRTRIKRGAERLRAALQERIPPRRSRIAGLLLFARRPVARIRDWLLFEPARLRGGLACALVLVGLVCLRWILAADPPQPAGRPVVAEAVNAQPSLRAELGAPASEARVPLERGSSTTVLGRGLRVELRWADDGSEAEHVPLALERTQGTLARDGAQILDSDGRGRVELADAEPGRWTLIPWTGQATTVDLPVGRSLDVELRLPRGRALAGDVVTPTRLRVPAWVEIWVSFPGRADLLRQMLFADQDGRFELHGIDGRAWVGARAPNRAPSLLLQAGPVSQSQGEAVPLELELGKAWSIRRVVHVRVQDASAQPIADALGQLCGDAQPRLDAWTGLWFRQPDSEIRPSAADGRMTLAREPGGREALCVQAAGYAPQRISLLPGSSAAGEIVVVLQRESEVFGQLLPTDPELPLEGVLVAAFASELARPVVARCGADGRFHLAGLPAGEIRVEAGIDDGRPGAGCVNVPLQQGAARSLLLPFNCDGSIQGVIVDETDEMPLAGWSVMLQDPDQPWPLSDGLFGAFRAARWTSTDAAGRFLFEGCAPGEYLVCARPGSRSDSAGVHVRARPSSRMLQIRAGTHPGASLRGWFDNPDPVGCPRPRLMLVSRMLEEVEWLDVDPRDGSFSCAGLLDGEYVLGTTLNSYGIVRLSNLTLKVDEQLDLGHVAPPRTGRLCLRVRDRNGAVPEWIELSYSSVQLPGALLPASHPRRLWADAQGEFVFDGLGPGRYELFGRLPDQQFVRGGATVAAGEPVAVELLH